MSYVKALEKETLRALLRKMRAESAMPMTSAEHALLGKLGSKYKFDPEFAGDIYVSGLPTVKNRSGTRSRLESLEHRPWGRVKR